MPNFHLDYEVLSGLNGRPIQLSMPSFESDGPFGHFVAMAAGWSWPRVWAFPP